jgi:hypothetical protein
MKNNTFGDLFILFLIIFSIIITSYTQSFRHLLIMFLIILGTRNAIKRGWIFGKICPNCRNRVNSHATVCQHCHSKFD